MSVFTIIKSLLQKIEDLFRQMPVELQKAVHIGVVVTENLKKVIDSPVADVLTALIPGDADDQIKIWLRAKLPGILVEMRLVDNTLGLIDPNKIAKAATDTLLAIGGLSAKDAHDLSVLVAQVAADDKLTWGDGVLLLQWYYEHQYKPTIENGSPVD